MPQQGSKGRAKHPGSESFKATRADYAQHQNHLLQSGLAYVWKNDKKELKISRYEPFRKLRKKLMRGSQTAAARHKISKRKKI